MSAATTAGVLTADNVASAALSIGGKIIDQKRKKKDKDRRVSFYKIIQDCIDQLTALSRLKCPMKKCMHNDHINDCKNVIEKLKKIIARIVRGTNSYKARNTIQTLVTNSTLGNFANLIIWNRVKKSLRFFMLFYGMGVCKINKSERKRCYTPIHYQQQLDSLDDSFTNLKYFHHIKDTSTNIWHIVTDPLSCINDRDRHLIRVRKGE